MPQATDSGSSNGLSGVKGWLLFLCITLVFLLPILKAGTTLYSVFMIGNLSNLPLSDFQEMIDDNPVAFINDLDNEQQKEVFRKVIPLLPDFQKCTEGFTSWLLLLVATKTGCTMMGFLCGILLWMKKPFGAKLLKIYPIAILLGVFVCFISLIYWRSNHPVLFSLQKLSAELSGFGMHIKPLKEMFANFFISGTMSAISSRKKPDLVFSRSMFICNKTFN